MESPNVQVEKNFATLVLSKEHHKNEINSKDIFSQRESNILFIESGS